MSYFYARNHRDNYSLRFMYRGDRDAYLNRHPNYDESEHIECPEGFHWRPGIDSLCEPPIMFEMIHPM